MCGRKFSIKTVCMTARQMVRKNIYIYFFRLPIFIIVMVIHYRLLLLYLLFDNFQSKPTLYLIWDHVYILYVMIHRSHVSRQYTTRTSSTETSNQITSSSDDQVQKPPTSFTQSTLVWRNNTETQKRNNTYHIGNGNHYRERRGICRLIRIWDVSRVGGMILKHLDMCLCIF